MLLEVLRTMCLAVAVVTDIVAVVAIVIVKVKVEVRVMTIATVSSFTSSVIPVVT